MAIPELRRVDKCRTCAFRSGTQANQSYTPLKAKLCAEIPEPFLCHEEQPQDILCAGWYELTERLQREGYYERQPCFQREIKEMIVESLAEAEEAQDHNRFLESLRARLAARAGR